MRPGSNLGIAAECRYRANSDNTYTQHIASRALKMPKANLQDTHSPRPSEGFLIKDDYFTAEKNKFFYQISSKNSGSSEQSNLSHDFNKLGGLTFLPKLNQLKT